MRSHERAIYLAAALTLLLALGGAWWLLAGRSEVEVPVASETGPGETAPGELAAPGEEGVRYVIGSGEVRAEPVRRTVVVLRGNGTGRGPVAGPALADTSSSSDPASSTTTPSTEGPSTEERRPATDPTPVAGRLLVPVEGVDPSELIDTFDDPRSGGRIHRATDVMAPRGTPVLAVTDGVILQLLDSDLGGISLHQLDAEGEHCFYYAHLDRYARGLAEGDRVRRGETLGYVGSTGNAHRDAPHLHFALYRLDSGKPCWQGEPIDPLPFFRSE